MTNAHTCPIADQPLHRWLIERGFADLPIAMPPQPRIPDPGTFQTTDLEHNPARIPWAASRHPQPFVA